MGSMNHEYTMNIVCPYCGYEFEDSFDLSGNMDDGDIEECICEECGKDFEYTLNVDVTYSTSKTRR